MAYDWERRVELAHERGYESPYYERQAREFAYEMGADRDTVEHVAHVFYAYEPGYTDDAGDWHHGSLDGEDFGIEEWRDLYAELHDLDPDDWEDWADDFYEWLQEYYDE